MRIDITHLSYRYRRGTYALHDVDLAIEDGVTGLLGPNGAGKTTLLSLLTGILKPASGQIVMDAIARSPGQTVRPYSIGFLPQRFSFANEMRCLDAVAYAAWVHGRANRELTALARQALETVDLSDKANRRIKSLSGGQRQRLGIAAALAHDPDLLVLDEPTVGLDPAQRLRLRETIRAIGDSRPVVLSTHLIEDVTHVCDRVAVLSRGRLAFDGTVKELVDRAEHGRAPTGPGSAFERAYVQLIDNLETAQ